jgi:DNA repair protein RadC
MTTNGRRLAVRELPTAERPRVRLVARGAAGLTAAELIGLLWASGSRTSSTTAIAQEAIVGVGGLAGLAASSPQELERMPGVGPARAAQLAAAFELGRRAVADWPPVRRTIRGPRDLGDRLVVELGRLEREEMRVVLMDTRNGILATPTVYRGNVSVALVRIGELFRDAVRLHASRLILVHNHPSGDPSPSPDDLHLTAEAVAAGRLLDIDVLDHLVIGHGTWVSLRDRGVPFDRGPVPPRS